MISCWIIFIKVSSRCLQEVKSSRLEGQDERDHFQKMAEPLTMAGCVLIFLQDENDMFRVVLGKLDDYNKEKWSISVYEFRSRVINAEKECRAETAHQSDTFKQTDQKRELQTANKLRHYKLNGSQILFFFKLDAYLGLHQIELDEKSSELSHSIYPLCNAFTFS